MWPADIKYRHLVAIVSKRDDKHIVSFDAFRKDYAFYECASDGCQLVNDEILNDQYPLQHSSHLCIKGAEDYQCDHMEDKNALKLHMIILSEVVPILQARLRSLVKGLAHRTIQDLLIATLEEVNGEWHEAGAGGDCLFHTFSYILDKLGIKTMTHSDMRKTLVEYIGANRHTLNQELKHDYIDTFVRDPDDPDDLSRFTDETYVLSNEEYQELEKDLSTEAHWGGYVCKMAFARLYDINIQELNYDNTEPYDPNDFVIDGKGRRQHRTVNNFALKQYKVNDDDDYIMIQFYDLHHFRPIVNRYTKTPIHHISSVKLEHMKST